MYSNLSSYLMGTATYKKLQFQQEHDYTPKSHKFEANEPKNIASGDFDEDMNEIKFVDIPTTYADISNNLQTLLITNNPTNSVFSHQA